MRRIPLMLAPGLLACFLGACTTLVPDPPEPAPSTQANTQPLQLPGDCPQAGAVEPVKGIAVGTDAQIAADLLAAVGRWTNAGTAMVTNEPAWIGPGVPGHCLADLAEALGRIYGPVLFAGNADETLASFRAGIVQENLANLKTAQAQGRATDAKRELALIQQSSQSESGTFLNLVVRRLESGSIQPAGMETWFVIVGPPKSQNLVFHLERKESPHGSFSW
ncbi:hypothetical protein [Arthrobacter sp. AQ5-05]|uniref:hypothetical protein n=1 Tax=Arthrobacter sp. AQ5-05 TaxID=2184581 RepID=UPI0011BF5D86|nr:hypothetical protein [Arthrobacter sp. AQ5-05]